MIQADGKEEKIALDKIYATNTMVEYLEENGLISVKPFGNPMNCEMGGRHGNVLLCQGGKKYSSSK
jgi:hypothetical protein